MNSKVIYLRQEDKPMRSILPPRSRRTWSWSRRKAGRSMFITAGLILGWVVALMMFCQATGGM